jgi:phenylacetate-coenzyme A ligase PaaK-like adenylate-forming protein
VDSRADGGRSDLTVGWDMLLAQHQGARGVAARRRRRLQSLIAHARTASPFYARLYRGIPLHGAGLTELPPVGKPELMAAFDEWVTDPAVTRVGIDAFMSDPSRVGTPYLGRYFACTSSGTTGHPGVFIHDQGAIRVYRASAIARMDRNWLSASQWVQLARQGRRWAVVVGTGGHYAGAGWVEFERRRGGWREKSYRVFSVQTPLPALVQQLNGFDPAILTSYPSTLGVLAMEADAGRLRVRPTLVEAGGETLSASAALGIEAALRAPLRSVYGSSECNPIAFSCALGNLHVSADWVVLEPVDASMRPVEPGIRSHSVLLTNLANKVQPIIRYDLGDSVTELPEPCPCGISLPAITVDGRKDDVLRMRDASGEWVHVVPLAVGSAVEHSPGLLRVQIVQTGPEDVRLRVQPRDGADRGLVEQQTVRDLREYLSGQGLGNVRVRVGPEAPSLSPTSGKFRQVLALHDS